MPFSIPLSEMVTFSPNRNIPIHRWFHYREGFSKAFVEWGVTSYSLQGPILDPFCGVGTTPLACKEMGLISIGCDTSPLMRFVAETKTKTYDLDSLQEEYAVLKKERFDFPREGRVDSWVAKRFHPQTFRELLFIKGYIRKEMTKSPLHDIALLALIDQTLRCANVERLGASLRRINKGYMPVRKFWVQKIGHMIKDLEKVPSEGYIPKILDDDARRLKHIESHSIGSIITSPPYLNKVEYASAYKLELALFFDESKTQLRSFIGEQVAMGEGESDLPIADAYLHDMLKCFRQFHRVLKDGGKAVVNVAGGCFPDRVVKSDELLMDIAKEEGFTLEDNIIARTIDCHKRHSGFVGKVNERVVVLVK
ncbi:MAG: hypothetical protein Q8P05_06295 [Candidatus Diapherotrites archaeon]|nr:hypothetical protein [Candidatus Diapherotrites archaeon]MDZ4256187.1 hypothetical protein [archaeon]